MYVLIAEDEPSSSELISELLDAYGASVIVLASADAALRYFMHQPAAIKLVITDVRLPGKLDGYDLARLIHQRQPKLPVIVTSGYERSPRPELNTNVFFLPKPWSLDEFDSVVRRFF